MSDRIIVDPQICSGKPMIRGTRIMVKNILGMVAGGYTVERILQAYPELTAADVSAALDTPPRWSRKNRSSPMPDQPLHLLLDQNIPPEKSGCAVSDENSRP